MKMKQIEIGTCIPGTEAEKWIPHMVNAGFECVAINFHMSLGGTDLAKLADKVKNMLDGTGVQVATLGYYCNAIENPDHWETLRHVVEMAPLFGAPMVSTFAGAYEGKSVEEAMPKFKEVFTDITNRAAEKGLKVAIENCPMGGNWQHCTCNIGFNPKAWEMMFNEVPADNFGLEWEPGHQIIQLIDPVAQLRQWVGKVIHMHGKDATVDMDAVRRLGVFGAHDFAPQRTPGFGDTNWRDIFSILHQGGYESDICVEGYHDPV